LVALAGCDLLALPPAERTPSVVGEIASTENVNGTQHYELESGESLDIDFGAFITTLDDAHGGDSGALLFFGEDEDPWYFTLREPRTRGEDYQFAVPAVDDDTHIIFGNGLLLPKAAGFDGRGWPQDGRYESPTGEAGFAPSCISEQGEVTAYLAMPSDRREGCPDAA
jgi:hypothetical protein